MRAREQGHSLLSLEDAQKELNSKMLAGWTMLGVMCPISNYPLLQHKESGKVWSIRCQAEICNEAPPNATETPPAQSSGVHERGLQEESDLQSLRLAEKVAEGWELSGEVCPVTKRCPLVIEPGTDRKWSAALNDFVDNSMSGQAEGSSQVAGGTSTEVGHTSTDKGGAPTGTASTHIPSSPPASMDEMSSRIGEKLLLGWTLLEKVCPVTDACPLMQDPSTQRLWSPALNGYIDTDEAEQPRRQEQPATVRASKDTSNNQTAPSKALSSSDDMSQAIGEKLLQGWVMKEEVCPVTGACPLLMDPKSQRLWSAALSDFVGNEPPTATVPSISVEPSPVKSAETSHPEGSSPKVTSEDEMSKLISQKMLQGWAMLGDVCPITGACPLMRDPATKRLWSAALNVFVDQTSTPQEQPLQQSVRAGETQTTNGQDNQAKNNPKTSQSPLELQSDRLSERLSTGWRMLEEVCPVTKSCPLMKEPGTNRKYSAALDKFLDEIPELGTATPSTPLVESAHPPNALPRDKLPDFLERVPEGQAFKPRSEENVAMPNSSSQALEKEGIVNEDQDNESEGEGDLGQYHFGSWKEPVDLEANQQQKRKMKKSQVRTTEEFNDALSTNSVLSGVSVNGDTSEELERTEATLRSKLREARVALASIEISLSSSPSEMEQSERLAQFIGQCGTALASVAQAAAAIAAAAPPISPNPPDQP